MVSVEHSQLFMIYIYLFVGIVKYWVLPEISPSHSKSVKKEASVYWGMVNSVYHAPARCRFGQQAHH
jgi:hypothetical protein